MNRLGPDVWRQFRASLTSGCDVAFNNVQCPAKHLGSSLRSAILQLIWISLLRRWREWRTGDAAMVRAGATVLRPGSATMLLRTWDVYRQKLHQARVERREQALRRQMAALGLREPRNPEVAAATAY